MACLMLTTCKKDKEIAPIEIKINNIETTSSTARIEGEYGYEDAIDDIYVLYGKNANLYDAKSVKMNQSDDGDRHKNISAELSGLQAGTTYYYAIECKTRYTSQRTEVDEFETEKYNTPDNPETPVEVELPTVITNNVTNITINSASCGGNVTSYGNGTVTARGVCWSEAQNPTINNIYSEETNEGAGVGSFSSQLTNLKENTTYYVRAYATNEAGTAYGEEKIFTTLEEEPDDPEIPEDPTTGEANGYDWVDLGLPSGIKWATCNVGADSPEEYGDYYAWGETETKSEYTEDNCSTYGEQMSDISGNARYDVARKKWGGTWRIPTKAEQQELLDNCEWEWTTQNGVNGYKVTGPNGNHIFLPAAGCRYGSSLGSAGSLGYYWGSTPGESDSNGAYDLNVGSGTHGVGWDGRFYGLSVRPVTE